MKGRCRDDAGVLSVRGAARVAATLWEWLVVLIAEPQEADSSGVTEARRTLVGQMIPSPAEPQALAGEQRC